MNAPFTFPQDSSDAVIASLRAEQDQRHAWLAAAAEKIRKWREEDRAAGIIWSDGK